MTNENIEADLEEAIMIRDRMWVEIREYKECPADTPQQMVIYSQQMVKLSRKLEEADRMVRCLEAVVKNPSQEGDD